MSVDGPRWNKLKRLQKSIRCSPAVYRLFRQVADLSVERSESVYVVGGYVRDRWLGVESLDVDFAVEGDGVAFAEALASKVGGRCEGFTRFGTAIVTVPGFGKVDVASTRRESYPSPGVLPEVRPSSLEEDLTRRDFTLNSIALRLLPGGRRVLMDPTHGLEDLKMGVLRAHHAKTFEDDPTRIFRAVRFEQRFGFRVEKRTLGWLKAALKGRFLERVTGERLRNELRLIFAEPCPERAIERLSALGVFKSLLSTWKAPGKIRGVPEALAALGRQRVLVEEPWMVWFSRLADGLGEGPRRILADRLMLSGLERKVLFQCGAPLRIAERTLQKKGRTLGTLYGVLSPLRPETRAVLFSKASPIGKKMLARYEKVMFALVPQVSGKDLIDLGRRPGPEFAALLEDALRLQLDGRLRTRAQALRWLESRVLKDIASLPRN